MSNEWNATYLSPQRQGGHYLRPRKRKSEEEILNDILERYKTNKQSEVEQSRQLQVLVIQEILRKNQNLDLEEFIEALDLHENDAELPVLQEYANIIIVGGKSIVQWFNDYVYEMANRGQKRKNIRQELNVGVQQLRQNVEFPFKSKIKAFQKIHGIDFDQNEFKTDDVVDIPDYQVKQLCKKFGRPYFSQNTGSWEIDLVFAMNPSIKKASSVYLFCININTKYLVVYPLVNKTADQILKTLQNLVKHQDVRYIRGDGEKGFAAPQLINFYRGPNNNLVKAFFISGSSAPFTNHNRIVDSVVRTIRNAFGLDERAFANPDLMQQMVEIYNYTPHKAFNNYFTPDQVNNNEDLEEIFIRKHNKELQEAKHKQIFEGLHNFQKGNIIMIHVDYSRTLHVFMKQRRNFNELAEFVAYVHGNVCCQPLRPFKDLKTIEIPIYYCKYYFQFETERSSTRLLRNLKADA
ncbi:MAG: hypothetical protein EZS28_017921 [Streblomastix strix]|uniref:Integrase catalytic domain-containing protein n=1 Tax=Streblomastix strix TaxID=222440 RepID=A0A5J4VW43_9EUKA|nr:MAG: hypothetical protein EZS28_017921 [Streblomastix strix]